MLQMILNRAKEPSTYAGLAGVLASVGVLGLDEAGWATIIAAVSGVAAVVAIFLRDPGAKADG
jgi:hypothetical protein